MDRMESKKRDGKGGKEADKEQFALEALEKAKDAPAEYFDDARSKSKIPAQLYRKLDPTQELAENNYYNLLIQQQTAGLIPVSEFLARLCPAYRRRAVPVAESGRGEPQFHRDDVRAVGARSAA